MAERKLPKDMETPPEIRSSFAEKMIVETREYKLITPLFGGGVEPNTPDPVTVIRATEIRGHLRFWWRATRGGQFETIEKLKEAEDLIWGAASKKGYERPSLVSIKVLDTTQGKADIPFVVEESHKKPKISTRKESKVPSYVAFPLQPPKDKQVLGMEIQPVYTDIVFTIKIAYPQKYKIDVEAALWAWELFGGLGARTRRGFGALKLIKLNDEDFANRHADDKESLIKSIKSKLEEFIEYEKWPKYVPHLLKDLEFAFLKGSPSEPYEIWDKLTKKLNQFRQYRIHKETNKYYKFGYSDWPEPNAIRSAFEKPLKGPHAKRRIQKFPRAQFGLPIVFHMPHDNNLSVILEGSTNSRLASPLILKPIALKKGAVGIGVILKGTSLPLPLTLKDQDAAEEFQVDSALTPNEANQIVLLKGETNVLKAFLNYLEQ